MNFIFLGGDWRQYATHQDMLQILSAPTLQNFTHSSLNSRCRYHYIQKYKLEPLGHGLLQISFTLTPGRWAHADSFMTGGLASLWYFGMNGANRLGFWECRKLAYFDTETEEYLCGDRGEAEAAIRERNRRRRQDRLKMQRSEEKRAKYKMICALI